MGNLYTQEKKRAKTPKDVGDDDELDDEVDEQKKNTVLNNISS